MNRDQFLKTLGLGGISVALHGCIPNRDIAEAISAGSDLVPSPDFETFAVRELTRFKVTLGSLGPLSADIKSARGSGSDEKLKAKLSAEKFLEASRRNNPEIGSTIEKFKQHPIYSGMWEIVDKSGSLDDLKKHVDKHGQSSNPKVMRHVNVMRDAMSNSFNSRITGIEDCKSEKFGQVFTDSIEAFKESFRKDKSLKKEEINACNAHSAFITAANKDLSDCMVAFTHNAVAPADSKGGRLGFWSWLGNAVLKVLAIAVAFAVVVTVIAAIVDGTALFEIGLLGFLSAVGYTAIPCLVVLAGVAIVCGIFEILGGGC